MKAETGTCQTALSWTAVYKSINILYSALFFNNFDQYNEVGFNQRLYQYYFNG